MLCVKTSGHAAVEASFTSLTARLTLVAGEMIVGTKKTLFMVSSSATTGCICTSAPAAALPLTMHVRSKQLQHPELSRQEKLSVQDEISTGLDSSTTYQIVKATRNFVHHREVHSSSSPAQC